MQPWSQPLLWAKGAAAAGTCNTTYNPSDKSATVTLSGGNLTATATVATNIAVRSTVGLSTGKHYFEIQATLSGASTSGSGEGICISSAPLTSVGVNATNALLVFRFGNIYFNGVDTTKSIGFLTFSNVVCFAIDFVNLRAWVRRDNGNWNGDAAANPATNTNGIDISAVFGSNAAYVVQTFAANGDTSTANFGGSAFVQTVPSGFTTGAGWCP
jgi:hypothetical protein